MRFLIDAQLPPALARWLTEQGQADHVVDLGLESSPDREVWRVAHEKRGGCPLGLFRLPEGPLERIKIEAHKRDIPYQSLIKAWLAEDVDRGRD